MSDPASTLNAANTRPTGPLPRLTPRETDILRAIAEGRTYQEAADHLGIKWGTVHGTMQRIFEKHGTGGTIETLNVRGWITVGE